MAQTCKTLKLMDLNSEQDTRSLTDEQLVDLFREGHRQTFRVIVDRYRQELFHFLVRFVGNRSTAEDVFQETFLKVYQSIDMVDTSRRFKPWLFTIAANKARDHLRRSDQRRFPQISGPRSGNDDQPMEIFDLMGADLPLPEEQIEREETQQRVKEAVDQLPDHLREILLLAYFQRFSYKQIAQILAIPLGTVKSRLHAAVASFGHLWSQRYEPKT